MSDRTFRITVPHSKSCRHPEWFFPNGWRGTGPTEQRDRDGRLRGVRSGNFPDWFVLACNDIRCEGRAVVPVSYITDHADALDPANTLKEPSDA